MAIDYDTLFYSVDNFCKGFEPWYQRHLLTSSVRHRHRDSKLKLSEILTIVIAYPQSGRSCFKYFYMDLYATARHLFPGLVHYARFVSLIKRAFVPLVHLFQSLRGEVTEFLFIDATPLAVCHNRREKRHRVFQAMAAKGKTSVGFFFGFKLHALINTKGDIVRLHITPGNVDDRSPVREMMKGLHATLIADKGYISQSLFEDLFHQGVTLITKVKKNMKNKLLTIPQKLMLMKRSFIETIFSSIKALGTLTHHRHRSPVNAFAHLIAGLIHYQLRTDKPSLQNFVNDLN